MNISQIKRINWKNYVRYHYDGNSLSELKECILKWKEKEDRDYEQFLIRTNPKNKELLSQFLNS